MFDNYVIERTPDNMRHLGKWICHLDITNWRDYTCMWDNNLDDIMKFVVGMGGTITGWQARNNEIILTVKF